MSYIKLVPDDGFHELIKTVAQNLRASQVSRELNTLQSFRLMLVALQTPSITFEVMEY